MRVIVTRHGETEENRKGIIQGHLPGVLSDLGREQAEKLAERLEEEDIDLIISSDLARALDTAKIIGEFHDGVDIVKDERLRNKDFRKFNGKSWSEVGITREAKLRDFFKEGEVESNEEIFVRAESLVRNILEKEEKNILLVGHRGINKMIIAILMGKTFEDLDHLKLKNTSISIFEGDGGNMKVKLLNCARHLDED